MINENISIKENDGIQRSVHARPFLKWAGGKSQPLEVLKSNLPENLGNDIKKYCEPFVGGGALLFALLENYRFEEVCINDINSELMNAYTVIRDNCGDILTELQKYQNEYGKKDVQSRRIYYYEKRDLFNSTLLGKKTSINKAALFIFLNKTCFNGLYRVNGSGKFNVPVGEYKNPLICDETNLKNVSFALSKVELKSCNYSECERFIDNNTFVYIDPPYRPLNKTSFTAYDTYGFNDEKQKELAGFFKSLDGKGAKLLLSNSDPKNADKEDNFFDNLYGGYNIQRVNALRMINSNAVNRGKITELLIKNY